MGPDEEELQAMIDAGEITSEQAEEMLYDDDTQGQLQGT